MRSFALLAAGLVGGGATLGLAPTVVLPAAGAATCTSAGGVSVVVDYRELGGSTVTACAPDGGGKSAAAVFSSVGVDISYATRQPGFVCRVNGVPASDPCVNASPANAYWGLWWSDGTTGAWTYATSGVGGQTVPAGGSVGWSWQQDRPSGSTVPPSVAPPVAPTATPSPSPTSSTASPTSSPTPTGGTGGSGGGGSGGGGSGGGGGTNGGSGGGKGGGTSPSATPSPTTSGSPSASPSARPSTPSESPLSTESPSDSTSSEPSEDPTMDPESPSDSPSSDPSEDPTLGTESPSDSTTSASPGAGEATPDEPARIPAAVTWGVVGLLAIAIVSSAWVARRRRGSGTP